MSATPPAPPEFRERRAASQVTDTACVPPGTLINVPVAPRNGKSGESPVVAVNTVHWYKDPAVLSALTGAAYALSEPIIQTLSKDGPINWRSLILGCVLALVAWLRTRYNTVTR